MGLNAIRTDKVTRTQMIRAQSFIKNLFKKYLHKPTTNKNYKFLPQKHWFAHDYCMMIHDIFAQTIVEGERAGVFNIEVKDESGELIKALEDHKGRDLIDLLEEHGRVYEVFMLLFRQIYVGILSDMTHFLYEALECSKKGKLTITFHLLRKPLTENLLYLEYLLVNPGEFIEHFWKGEIDHFGLGRNQTLDAKEIINKVYEQYKLLHFEDPDFLYEIRYKKDSEQSFQTYFQRATHLVTQAKAYKTENTNFNFIYSQEDTREGQWEGLYAYLPIILYHAYQVVEALGKAIAKRAGAELDVTDQRVTVGYLLWEKYSHWYDYGKNNRLNDLRQLWDISEIPCLHCKKPIDATEENYELFYDKGHLNCSSCSKLNDLIKPFLEKAKRDLKSQFK